MSGLSKKDDRARFSIELGANERSSSVHKKRERRMKLIKDHQKRGKPRKEERERERERSLWPPSHHVPRNKKFLLLGLVRIEAVVNLSWPICSYVKCKMLMNIFYILFILFS